VQRHAARRLHFDFRLELDGTLKSWAVPKTPGLEPGARRLAVHVEDHPLAYGRFEGEIPKGHYGAGTVAIWDRGHWRPDGDPRRGYRAGRLSFELDGERLRGRWSLVRMRRDAGEKGDPWLLIRRTSPSAPARRPAAALPPAIPFQLATASDEVPDGEDWLHELKLDGYRLACRLEDGAARLTTRNGHDWTHRFAKIARAASRLPAERAWLDGEVVVFDRSGVSRFGALQSGLEEGRARVVYVVFDCLWLDERDLRGEPLEARKQALARLLRKAPPEIRGLDHVLGDGQHFFAEACRHGAEGVISKQRRSPHEGRRTRAWVKVRCVARQEFVVGGYTPEAGSGRGLGALLVGTYDAEGRLVYAGRVGTGFDADTRAGLLKRFAALRAKESSFDPPVPVREARGARYVRPRVVVEVRFKEWTEAGRLRQPVFLGVREDKAPREIVRETAAAAHATAPAARAHPTRSRSASTTGSGARVAGVAISHPERVIDPASQLTKLDLARYYDAVWPRIEPHLRDRALSVVRCPDGLADKCFFQKHAFARAIPGIRAVSVDGHPGLVVESREGLVGLVQNGVVELHASGARTRAPQRPDRIVLDLDPDPALPFAEVRQAALRLRALLARLQLRSFVKTTGGKGLHVVVPVASSARGADWNEVRAFTRALGKTLAAERGSRLVLTASKAQRHGRIYFDDVRNRPGSTAVLPWSVRAREGAPVAIPLSWAELQRARERIVVSTTDSLRRGAPGSRSPWPDLDHVKQALPGGLRLDGPRADTLRARARGLPAQEIRSTFAIRVT